jgi:hypothetical protein
VRLRRAAASTLQERSHREGETPAEGGKPSAYPPSDSESRSDALAGVQICRQENLSEKRRARFGQRSCPRLARSVGSSANHAKQIGRTRPLFIGQTSLALPRVNRTDSHSESPRPLSHGRISPALGRPTPIQPFPNPDMDGINRHATTSQPSFGSNTRTTRFRLNLPTSLKSVDSHLRLKVMIWYNMSRQWRKQKSPAGGEVSADGEEKSSPLTLMTVCDDE